MAGHEAPCTIAELFQLLKNGRLETIEKLLKKHGVPRSIGPMTDYRFLQQTLKYKHTKIVKILINANCRVKPVPTDSGITPLAQAFVNENKEIATMLMKKGATVYVNTSSATNVDRSSATNVDRSSATNVLHMATERRSVKMLKVAVNAKINVNLPNRDGKTAMQMLLATYNPEFKNPDQKYLKDEIEMIRLLISKGASVDFKVGGNRTALHQIVTLKQEDLIKSVLIKCNDAINQCDHAGDTPLHVLLKCQWKSEDDVYKITKLFLEKGAKINIASSQNVAVSHLAAERKYLKVLNKFLQYDCDVSLQDCDGNTVLHSLLVKSAHLNANKFFKQLVESILSKAALENIQNCDKKTPVHLAAEDYHYGILEKMLPKLQDVNVKDWIGDSILHKLVKIFSKENSRIIEHLLVIGGDADLKNGSNESPFDIAFKIGNEELLSLLIPHCKCLEKYSFQSEKITEFAQRFIHKSAGINAVDESN